MTLHQRSSLHDTHHLVPCHPSLVSIDMEPKAVNVFRNGANALLLLVTG